MNSDFKDLMRIFGEEGFEFLVVGAYAVILADLDELRRALGPTFPLPLVR